MTNQDIETFFAVLDHGTMTAAAEALYITQPSLSARLKSLEDQVGAPLFHRGKGQRRITLTDAGQHFLPLARRWQNLLSETQTFAAAEKREFLHVIAAYTANQYILPPVYQRFLERELPVNLWVESMRTDQAVSAVARGDADMAIVDGALHYDLQIEAKPLFREGFFLVVPKTVALTEPVEATTLHVQDEILIYGQPEILQWHDYWYGVDARPLLYTDTPQLAETLPACGKRWSIIPAGATEPYLRMFSNVQVLRLAHPPAERTFYLVTPKGRGLTASAELLLEDMQREYDAGNWCVAGGDFNKDLLGDSSVYFGAAEQEYSWAQPIPEGVFDSYDVQLVAPLDENDPVPSCRNADGPYHDGQYVLTVDGFLVTPNVAVDSAAVLDTGFAYSDHNPVQMTFTLQK